jgi:L-threonylcarbamoyladenylate synthase
VLFFCKSLALFMPFLSTSAEDIAHAARLLQEGACVALPTETVYGLAADALNEVAVARVFSIKGRPLIDPLIVHIHERAQLGLICKQVDPLVDALADAFWPGPLTLILPKSDAVPDMVTAGLKSVAVRMPAHPAILSVMRACGLPLAAPSANPFGYVSPTTAEHVAHSLKAQCPHILDGGPCEHGLESTIVSVIEPEHPRLLRAGPISETAIESVVGKPLVRGSRADANASQPAPGLLTKHYSPSTPAFMFHADRLPPGFKTQRRSAWIWIKRPTPQQAALPGQHHWLSEQGDMIEVAHRLFALLRAVDMASVDQIYMQAPPPEGLGLAVLDRMTRASAS